MTCTPYPAHFVSDFDIKQVHVGQELKFDVDTLVDWDRSLAQGAIRHRHFTEGRWLLKVVRNSNLFDFDKPLKKFSPRELDLLLYSEKTHLKDHEGNRFYNINFEGIVTGIKRRTSGREGADHIIDLGPGAGRLGGRVTFEGTTEALKASDTVTGRYLKRAKNKRPERRHPSGLLTIKNAALHNLKNVTVDIPIGVFVWGAERVFPAARRREAVRIIDKIGDQPEAIWHPGLFSGSAGRP